jgi:hypothetical protein
MKSFHAMQPEFDALYEMLKVFAEAEREASAVFKDEAGPALQFRFPPHLLRSEYKKLSPNMSYSIANLLWIFNESTSLWRYLGTLEDTIVEEELSFIELQENNADETKLHDAQIRLNSLNRDFKKCSRRAWQGYMLVNCAAVC